MKEKILNFFKKIFKAEILTQVENILLYFCNGEALPNILNEKEEEILIKKLDENDEFAKQKLIEHNLRLVVYVAKKFDNSDIDIEDLISIGSFGLIKAINSFKSDKNIKIATYASKCIENEILMYLRKTSKQKNEISLDEPINIDGEGNELLLYDLIPNEENTPQGKMEQKSEIKILWQVINSLNNREKEIMVLRFGLNGSNERTQKEVADTLGISQSYISRLEKKTVGRLKKEIQKLA